MHGEIKASPVHLQGRLLQCILSAIGEILRQAVSPRPRGMMENLTLRFQAAATPAFTQHTLILEHLPSEWYNPDAVERLHPHLEHEIKHEYLQS